MNITEKIKLAEHWIKKLKTQIDELNIKISKAEEWSVRRALVEDKMRAENNLADWKIELDKVKEKVLNP